jgi:tetratricopeptide (TPR) repeat protein
VSLFLRPFALSSVILCLAASLQPAAANDVENCMKRSDQAAVNACTRAIKSGRYKGDVLADLYHKRGVEHEDDDDAEADFSQAIRINPKHAKAYHGRGFMLYLKGKYAQALADFDESLRLKPNAVSYAFRAGIHERQGNLSAAMDDYNASIQLEPTNEHNLLSRGRLHLKNNDKDRAIADLNAVLKLKPGNKEALQELAKLPEQPSVQQSTDAPTATGCAQAETHWKSAEKIDALAGYEDHLKRFPTCAFADLAKAMIEKLKK